MSRTLMIICMLPAVASCASNPRLHLPGDDASLLQTRAAMFAKCPQAEVGARREFPGAALGALVAPLIDTAVKTGINAVKKLGEPRTKEYHAQTVSRFYSADPIGEDSLEPYELTENLQNGCLVVVRGYFSNSQDKFTASKFLNLEAIQPLKRQFGLAAEPEFYFEGQMVYSADRAGFRIKTATLHYPGRLQSSGHGPRKLDLHLTFAKPSGAAEGAAFAVGVINLDLVGRSIGISGSPLNGASLAVETVQTSLGTGYMPLPALDTGFGAHLTAARQRLENLNTTINEIAAKIDAHVQQEFTQSAEFKNDPIKATQAILSDPAFQTKLRRAVASVDAVIADRKGKIAALNRQLDASLLNARHSLEDQSNPPANSAEAAQRLVDRRTFMLTETERLGRMGGELAAAISKKTDLQSIAKSKDQISLAAEKTKIDKSRLELVQPVIISAKITETIPPNRFARFFGSVLEGAEGGITTALKKELDPVTIKTLEEAEQKQITEMLDKIDKAKSDATKALFDLRAAQIAYEALPAGASASERVAKEKDVALGILAAKSACRKAAELDAAPSDCNMLM